MSELFASIFTRKSIYALALALFFYIVAFTLQTFWKNEKRDNPLWDPTVQHSDHTYTSDEPLFRAELANRGFNLSTSCDLGEHRHNPLVDFDKYDCPVKNISLWKDLNKLKVAGPGKYSSVNCSAAKHCVYENICIKEKLVHYYQPNPSSPYTDFGWYPYRGYGTKTTFSFRYGLKIVTTPPTTAPWINGTSLFYDQSFDALWYGLFHKSEVVLFNRFTIRSHVGHSSEFYNKLVELRSTFPYKIDRILYGSDTEVYRRAKYAYTLCATPCNLLRIAFEPEGWVFPDIYMLQWPNLTLPGYNKYFPFTNELTCFERLLVPSNEHQHFTSREAAENHRNAALRMCNIPKRTEAKTKLYPSKILFWQRTADRLIANARELCTFLNSRGFEAFVESEDHTDFCHKMATIYSADIIITVDGSHNFMLPFARPGSVVIIVFPYNFRIPDWKLMAYYSGLRVLELMTVNKSLSLPAKGDAVDSPTFLDKNKQRQSALDVPLKDCTYIMCRMALRNRNTIVPIESLAKFIDRAMDLFNVDSVEPCEKPLTWPAQIPANASKYEYIDNWTQYGWENNYDVCEPPYPNCICCYSESCMNGTRYNTRPF